MIVILGAVLYDDLLQNRFFKTRPFQNKFFSFLIFFLGVQALSAQAYALDKESCQSVKDELRVGDLVFIEIDNVIFQKVSEAQQSWANHVGVVVKEGLIAESKIPLSQNTDACDYIGRSKDYRFTVRRPRNPLSDTEAQILLEASESRLKVLYDTGFNFDSSRQFCSKFVHQVYKEATGKSVGHLQSFQSLLDSQPNADLDFWKFWFLGKIPWERTTITPASQLLDPQFVTVLESKNLSQISL